MTKEGMVRMAREIFDVTTDGRGRETFSGDSFGIERFAALVVAVEREACAKVCYELPWKDAGPIPSNLAFAAAIRARSEV